MVTFAFYLLAGLFPAIFGFLHGGVGEVPVVDGASLVEPHPRPSPSSRTSVKPSWG